MGSCLEVPFKPITRSVSSLDIYIRLERIFFSKCSVEKTEYCIILHVVKSCVLHRNCSLLSLLCCFYMLCYIYIDLACSVRVKMVSSVT